MAQQGQTAGRAPAEGSVTPIIVIGVLAAIFNFAITTATVYGHTLFFPVNILGGFSFNVAPLLPASTALILGYGLWQYSGVRAGPAVIAAIFIFATPIVLVQVWNALTGVLLNMLPDSVVTNSQNFYGIFFAQRMVSVLSVMVVIAIASRQFRNWPVWILLIIVWAGGDTLLFGLFRDSVITRDAYQWLYPVERVIGFLILGAYFARRA
ncbi:MAG TPA: hypothetical protein VL993_13015 [Stellaceae bacterium]|nr:hypothetical protein [Stellaceae bacterium]